MISAAITTVTTLEPWASWIRDATKKGRATAGIMGPSTRESSGPRPPWAMTYPKAPAPQRSKIITPALLVALLIVSSASPFARAAERRAPARRATSGEPKRPIGG